MSVHQTVLIIQSSKRAVRFHLAESRVHELQQILLPLAHQNANLPVGEGLVQQRSRQPAVRLLETYDNKGKLESTQTLTSIEGL